MHQAVEKLIHKIIVSCQAYEDTPLYGADYMKRMAECAIMGGAAGIRACWPQDIKAIRECCDKPIIGINKYITEGDPLDEIIITPTFEAAEEVIEAGADIIGLDCTIRPSRGFEELTKLLEHIKKLYPDIAIMADIASYEEGIKVAETGLVDIISTTLSGYTRATLCDYGDEPNVELLKQLKASISIPINAEGRVWELSHLSSLLDAGADMVTIGTAITRPHLITKRFTDFNNEYLKHLTGK